MDIVQKCEKDQTMIHCFEFKEEIVLRFEKAIEKKKLNGSTQVEKLILEWLRKEGM
ncbi:hypothetical protein [Endozoicomonas atrinae]|uniref:hypothetical protein n=1 Tax=Endozoicomonas atrinae TaxID=1333660 RepID=UPI000A46D975|nr:hypothetical protein [Endozoicomonas atrinae]